MEHQLLDADFEQKKIKPWSVWKVGFGCGIISSLIGVVFALNPLPIYIPSLLTMLLFFLIAQAVIAAFGSRNEHFASIWLSGAIVILCNAFSIVVTAVFQYGSVAGGVSFFIGLVIGLPLFSLFPAFLFWVIPGKLPYFKNKIQEPSVNLPQNP